MDASATQKVASQFPAFRHTVARRMAGYRERLARKIGEELAERQWSNEDLALRSGVSTKTIKRLRGAKHDARPSTVRRIAEGFELPTAEFSPEAEADQLARIEAALDDLVDGVALLLASAGDRKLARQIEQASEQRRKKRRGATGSD